jgi:hypothetical protein
MYLHEKGKATAVEKVSGGLSTRQADCMAWPVGRHLVNYRLDQVGGALPHPYKYPPTGENENTHHILEIPVAKLSFLVYYLGVALSGEWRDSDGWRTSRPVGSPPRSSSVEALLKSFRVQ